MWPDSPSNSDIATLEVREAELLDDDRSFGAVVARGATLF